MDESTPHMHIVFVPVIQKKDKNGSIVNKIACSEYWKGKEIAIGSCKTVFINYISRTFQVVNLLFDFSTDSLKRIVDDFIKDIENNEKH